MLRRQILSEPVVTYEVVKDGSTNPHATGAVEPYVAVSQVDSKAGEGPAGAEPETDERNAFEVRLAREDISRPSPRLTSVIGDSVGLARMILDRVVR